MKKRIALVVSIMLVIIMSLSVFVACGKSSDNFSKFIKTAPDRGYDVVVSTAANIGENISIVADASTNNAVVYKDVTDVANPKYMLFDVKNNKEAVAWTSNQIEYNYILNVWYYLDKAIVIGDAVKVVDYEGTVVATVKDVSYLVEERYVAVGPKQTLLRNNITNDCYLFEDGKFLSEKVAGINDFPSRLNGCLVSEKYTIVMKESGLLIYDSASLGLRKVISLENYLSSVCNVLSVNMLDDGNIVFQTVEYLADEAKKYDVTINGGGGQILKINLSTYIINIEKEKIKEIEFDFILSSLVNKNTLGVDYNSNYPNYSFAKKIVDKAMSSSTSLVAFDNNLKVKFEGDEVIFGGISKLSQVGDALWCVESDSKTLIVDKDGKVVNKYSGTKAQMGISSTLWNVGFRMSSSNAVVKFDETVSFEGSLNGKDVLLTNGASTIYSESAVVGETRYFWTGNNGQVIELNANGETLLPYLSSYLFAIQSSDDATIKFYSVLNGSELKSFEATNINVATLKDGSIAIYEKSGAVTIFSKGEMIFNQEG